MASWRLPCSWQHRSCRTHPPSTQAPSTHWARHWLDQDTDGTVTSAAQDSVTLPGTVTAQSTISSLAVPCPAAGCSSPPASLARWVRPQGSRSARGSPAALDEGRPAARLVARFHRRPVQPNDRGLNRGLPDDIDCSEGPDLRGSHPARLGATVVRVPPKVRSERGSTGRKSQPRVSCEPDTDASERLARLD